MHLFPLSKWSFALLVTLAAGFSPAAFGEEVKCSKPLKIGVILPLSGDTATAGVAIRNGTLMAARNLANRCKVELVFEDDQLQQSRSVASFYKLTSFDKIDALIVFSSGSGKAIAPLADTAKIPVIAIASDAAVSRGKKFTFNHWVTPESQAKLLVPEALRRGYKKIVIVSSEHDGTLAAR